MEKKGYNTTKIIYGIARLTSEWEDNKERYTWFCTDRWKERGIYEHMLKEFVNSKEPITLRAYDLDADNFKLLLDFVNWAY